MGTPFWYICMLYIDVLLYLKGSGFVWPDPKRVDKAVSCCVRVHAYELIPVNSLKRKVCSKICFCLFICCCFWLLIFFSRAHLLLTLSSRLLTHFFSSLYLFRCSFSGLLFFLSRLPSFSPPAHLPATCLQSVSGSDTHLVLEWTPRGKTWSDEISGTSWIVIDYFEIDSCCICYKNLKLHHLALCTVHCESRNLSMACWLSIESTFKFRSAFTYF